MATVDTLLKRLKTCENDSQKFAHLIILSKVVKPESLTPEVLLEVSRAVSFQFVARLLRAGSANENAKLFWQIGVTILKTCFLSEGYVVALVEGTNRLLKVATESKDPVVENEVLDIIEFLAHSASPKDTMRLCEMVLSRFKDMINLKGWCLVLRRLFEKLDLDGDGGRKLEEAMVSAIENIISNIETVAPTSIDKNLNLLVGAVVLLSSKTFLYQKIPNLPILLSSVENFLNSKIPAEKRLVLLQVGPFLTDIYSCKSWSGTKVCYSLCCIELKLALEELVHRYEESGQVGMSNIYLEGVLACCGTIENSIDEMVEENNQIAGELVLSMINDVRMAMKSVMFYIQKGLVGQGAFVPVLRLFMRWLSDDSTDVKEIILTFTVLKDFFRVPKNYSEYGGFVVSAVIFQMEDKTFRDYVKSDLAYFLLEVGLQGIPSSQPFVFAPIFNDLLTYDIYLQMAKMTEKDGISQRLCDLFCHDNKTFTLDTLCLIQLASYLILCFTKRNTSINSVCDYYNPSRWICKSINYLLSPVKETEPPNNWLDLKDVWFSSVNSVCELVEKSSDELLFEHVDMEFLISKSMNYSETGDDVSGVLEEMLSLIVGSN